MKAVFYGTPPSERYTVKKLAEYLSCDYDALIIRINQLVADGFLQKYHDPDVSLRSYFFCTTPSTVYTIYEMESYDPSAPRS